MEEQTNIGVDAIPEVNQEFLSQSTDIGGVLNPTSYASTPLVLPKITPVAAVQIPQSYTQAPKITQNPQVPGSSSSMRDDLVAMATASQDKYKYGKTWTYDADYTGVFYDRYANMGSLSKKLGFSPWRNNDEIYNSSSTWADNFKRSMRNSMSLANISFKGSLPWNAWDGEVSLEDAKNQERAFAEGQDSRGTIGASANNLFLNTGFTVGVLGELAAETVVIEGAALLAAPLTGGGSEVAGQVAEAAEIAKATKSLLSIPQMLNKLKSTATAVKDLNWAREFYSYAKSGKYLTPNFVDYVREMNKLSKAGTELNSLAKVSKGVGAFYRDVQMVNGALSESKMEAGSVELELRDKITDQFYAENNKMPSPEEYSKIYAQARAGGDETFWMNLPAIYLSNKIVFDKAFSSLRPMRATREALSKGLRDWTLKEGADGLFVPIKTGMRADLKSLFDKTTWNPKNLTKNMLGKIVNYSKANITEGFQEQYQEGVSGAMKEYYQDTFFNSALIGQKASYLGKNMADQFTTAQGWETFASGFLTGGIIQGPQHIVFTKGSQLAERIIDKQGYNDARKAGEEKAYKEANALNDLIKFARETTKNADANAGVQIRNAEYLRGATESQDKKSYIDIVGDSMSKHFYTLAKSGKLSIFRDSLKDMNTMSSQELVDAFGKVEDTVDKSAEKHRATLSGMMDMSVEIEKEHKRVSEVFENPFNPWRYNKEKDPDNFEKEARAYGAFEQAKELAVMSSYHFNNVSQRLTSLYEKAASNKPLDTASAEDFQLLYGTVSSMEGAMSNLQAEIVAMENIAGSDKKELKQKKRRLKFLEEVADARSAFDEVQDQESKFGTRKDDDERDDVLAKLAIEVGSEVSYRGQDGKIHSFTVDSIKNTTVFDENNRASQVMMVYDKNGKRFKRENLLLNDTIRAGSKVTFTDKDNGKTNTFIVARTKKTVVYDSQGKSYPKKSVQLTNEKDRTGSIGTILQSKSEQLFEAYSNYVRYLADSKNDILFDSKLESSFRDYLDFLRLHPEKFAMAEAVNYLNNPEHLREVFRAAQRAQEAIEEMSVELLEAALVDYRKKYAKNEFLNKLLEEGMFLDEESLELLFKGEMKGVILRHAVAPYAPVTTANDSEKYKKGIALLNQWLEANNFAKAEEQSPATPPPAPGTTDGTMTQTTPYGTPAGPTVNTTSTQTPVSDIEAKKADIERRRQEELESLPFSDDVKQTLEFAKTKGEERYLRQLKIEANKTQEGNVILDRYKAEDILSNPNSTIEERVAAKVHLEDSSKPMNDAQITDIRRMITDELSTVPAGEGKAYWTDSTRKLKKIYDAELAALKAKPSATTTALKSTEKSRLEALGYKEPEYKTFDDDTVTEILLNGTTKAKRDENIAKGKLTEKEKQAQKEKEERNKIKDSLLSEIAGAKNLDELFETEQAINDWVQDNAENTEQEAKELYDALTNRRIALNSLTYESLNIGDWVLYEGEVYKIENKSKNILYIRTIKGAISKEAKIAAKDVPAKLKKPNIPMDPKPPVNPEVQDTANENVENMETIISTEEKTNISQDGKSLAENKNIISDFENTLGCE